MSGHACCRGRCAISERERQSLLDTARWGVALVAPAALAVLALVTGAPVGVAATAAALGAAAGLLWLRSDRSDDPSDLLPADALPELIVQTDAEGRIVRVNEAAQRALGYPPGELIGRELASLTTEPPPYLGDTAEALGGISDDDAPRQTSWTAGWRCHDGALLPLACVVIPYSRRNGAFAGIRTVAPDPTDQITSHRALRESEEHFRTALDTARNGIMLIAHDRRIVLANEAIRALLRYSDEEITHLSLADILPPSHLDRVADLIASRMWSDVGRGHYEVQLLDAHGALVDVEISLSPIREGGRSSGVLVDVLDLAEARRASETIRRMTDYDRLTGLPNRELFDRHVQRALVDAHSLDRAVAVLMIDVDRFKLVNDTLGHASGDRLLKAVADRLTAQTPQQHVVARFGGDEFLLLAPDLGGPAAAEAVARRVLSAFRQPFEHDGLLIKLSGSVGVASSGAVDTDADTLIRIADAALHEAKATGRDRYVMGSDAASDPARTRLALEADLRHAVEHDELEVHYQPQCDTQTGEVRGLEALLRWNHPTRGPISPAEFVPLLEETGLIVPVGEWVLRTACAQVAAWHAGGVTHARVAVNLSPRQLLAPNLDVLVRDVLEETGLAPEALELELTETAAMLNLEATLEVLEGLHATGVTIAIDDFGVGQSWLVRLKEFPIRTLKVDRYFVACVHDSPGGIAIVQAIVALGHALGLLVVAEGVETSAELAAIRATGCDLVQGFFYSPALSIAGIEARLVDGEALRPAS